MKYDDEAFISLLEKVESQGGEHSVERCKARRYEFTGDLVKPVQMAGCGEYTLLDIPYDPRASVWVDEPVMITDPNNPEHHTAKQEQVGEDKQGNPIYEVVTERVMRSGEKAEQPGLITVCAIEDAVAAWPRFQ